ncbi:MAG: RNA methyltransferase [Cytophagales bacterium]|nr:RNA methyltransferase [Cytophagales bacterium]
MLEQEQIEILEPFVTANKQQLIKEVLARRTRYFTVVLEDIYKPHNASAVIRTCECLGVQDVHVIENVEEYHVNPYVVRGASQWLNVQHYKERGNNTVDCLQSLKKDGYQIVATSVGEDAVSLDDFQLTQKSAFVFGNEHSGVSKEVLDYADIKLKVPMFGFTESYNLSVSAAIILNQARLQIEKSLINWHLSEPEMEELKLVWYKEIVKNSDIILRNALP